MAELTPNQIRVKSEKDLFAFSRAVLGYDRMQETPHRELCEFLQRDKKKKLILMPRGMFKTSLCSIAYPLWRLTKDPNLRILIVSEVHTRATRILREIKGHLAQSTRYTLIFGDKKSGEVWKEDEVLLKGRTRNVKEGSITAAGLDTLGAGPHYDIIIVDDPQSNLNTGTKDQIDKVWDQFLLMLSLLEPNGELFVVMTRWHKGDVAGRIIRDQRSDYDIIIKEAYRRDEKGDLTEEPLCPEVLSKKFLSETRRAQGPYIFSGQYLNNPVPADEAKFMPGWIRFYKKAPQLLRVTMTVDPASRQRKDSDYTVMLVQGMDVHRRRYVLDIVRDRMSPKQTIETLFAMMDKWNPVRIGFEAVGFQETYRQFIEDERRRRGYTTSIEEMHPKAFRKEERIQRLIPFYESSLIMWPEHCFRRVVDGQIKDMIEVFREEYESFPNGEHDDIMDAQAYQMDIEAPPTPPKPPTEAEKLKAYEKKIKDMQGEMTELNKDREEDYTWAEQ